MEIGTYRISLIQPPCNLVVELGPEGRRDVALVVPAPVQVSVRVIDDRTSADADIQYINWHPKWPGRVGDTPMIGAGTYANDATLAYSGTGRGEIFIRTVLGHELHARMAYKGEDLTAACDTMIFGDLKRMGGGAGLIAVGRDGTVTLPFNTAGMFRGVAAESDGWVSIYDERERL